jgi:hypothetical protein
MMDKNLRNLVSCILLLALAGVVTGAGYCAAGTGGNGPLSAGTPAPVITYDTPCSLCRDSCDAHYSDCPLNHWFCMFGCGIGVCRLPPVFLETGRMQ